MSILKYKFILILLFFLWTLISFVRISIYSVKAIDDKLSFVNLSEEKQKEKIYGDAYYDFIRIKKIIPDNNTGLYVSSNTWEYFLLRYLLYPKKIIDTNSPQFTGHFSDYRYLVTDTKDSIPSNYNGIIIKLER